MFEVSLTWNGEHLGVSEDEVRKRGGRLFFFVELFFFDLP